MKKIKIIMLSLVLAMSMGLMSVNNASASSLSKELEGVELMNAYVDFLAHWVSVVEKPANAIGIAQNSLKDLYLENNEPERIEQVLLNALKVVEDRGARNTIRFTLAEVYQELDQPKKASEQFIKIIEENAKVKMPVSMGTKSVFE